MRIFPSFAALALAWIIGGASASWAMDFTMESAVAFALRNNRTLQASYFEIEQARARLLQAGLWPNPELDIAFATDAVFTEEGEKSFNIGLMQPLPISGRLRFATEVRRLDIARAAAEIRDRERMLIGETQKTFLSALAAREKLAVLSDAAGIAARNKELLAERLAAGQSAVSDVSLADVERLKFEQVSATMQAEYNTALLDLRLLLGLQPEDSISLRGSMPALAKTLQRPGRPLAVRPDLWARQLVKQSAIAEGRLAKAEAWEDISVGIEYDYGKTMDEPEGLTVDEMIGFRVTVPLPVWNRNQGKVAEQQSAAARAQAETAALQLQIDKETATARKRAADFRKVLRIYENKTEPSLREAEKQLDASYSSGRGDLRDILMVRSRQTELRMEYVSVYLQYVMALSDLETALGANRQLPQGLLERSIVPSKNPKQKNKSTDGFATNPRTRPS